ncbi:hypothetical protein SAY86_020066 [Trapa natans]|uniref:NAC domain-containing protein n=1 Tax=Trapa natans TaxID=22666 RepID=A0AAN7R3U4_TRANT|nr:hypothetical protein SAY86_020066 [Trapa natans]
MKSQIEMPPGFRFHPTDDELVNHYLVRKCAAQPIAVPIIAEIDLYKFDPWELPEMALYGEKEWYFFSPRDRKYPNGSRPNRAARNGYWKATGADKPIGRPNPLGIKKALVFYAGKAPKGVKTNWIMHEYRLANVDRSAGKNRNQRLDDWVLCRIYNKKGRIEKHLDPDRKSSGAENLQDFAETNCEISMLEPKKTTTIDHLHYMESSDSFPRLHTESSGSEEHVLSPEIVCEREEVQSEPKWSFLDSAFDFQLDSLDKFLEEIPFVPEASQQQLLAQQNQVSLSPAEEDIFLYM